MRRTRWHCAWNFFNAIGGESVGRGHAAPRFLAILASVLCFTACGGDGDSGAAAGVPPVAQTPMNSAPTIGGEPVTAMAIGETYFFQPLAADADNDSLQFTVSNLPPWASFNTTTGRLVGTPGVGDMGRYAAISIEVSDGKTRVALPAFDIVVAAVGSGIATLSWMPPVENVDASPLTDLSGYRILYGRDPDTLDRSIEIDNPSLTRYVVENLPAGTWHFAVIVLKADGADSVLSNIASKTIH